MLPVITEGEAYHSLILKTIHVYGPGTYDMRIIVLAYLLEMFLNEYILYFPFYSEPATTASD